MIFVIWTVVFISVLILYMNKVTLRFEKHGVHFIKPVPMLGNVGLTILRINHMVDEFDRLRDMFPEDRFVVRFELTKPVLLVFDPELIKKITVKHFEHFLDHRALVDASVDPFFGRNLFTLRAQEWKEMRSTLSPAFTSLKIRLMVPFMKEVGEQMILALKNQILRSEKKYINVDSKDLTTRYATDVIASCAFGLKVNSYTEPENEFYKMSKIASHFGLKQVFIFLGYTTVPALLRLLNIKFFTDDTSEFFKNLVLNTMKDRETKNIIRHDMIHLLMEAKKGKLKHEDKATNERDTGYSTAEPYIGNETLIKEWSDSDLTAQALNFLVAGFETVSTAMSFMIYELAVNPDVQERLYQEIKKNNENNHGNVDFDSIQHLKYLDMVMSEVLRLWPPAIAIDRLCIKNYNLGRSSAESTRDYIAGLAREYQRTGISGANSARINFKGLLRQIKRGEALIIPIWSIQRNSKFYPNPLKFDPERFNDENKQKIKPFTYIPFGEGPRNCIGSRFALCEVKVMIYQLLQHFEFCPSDESQIPLKLFKNTFNLHIRRGRWIRMKLRDS